MNIIVVAIAVASSLVTPEPCTEKSYRAYVAQLSSVATARPEVQVEAQAFQGWMSNYPQE